MLRFRIWRLASLENCCHLFSVGAGHCDLNQLIKNKIKRTKLCFFLYAGVSKFGPIFFATFRCIFKFPLKSNQAAAEKNCQYFFCHRRSYWLFFFFFFFSSKVNLWWRKKLVKNLSCCCCGINSSLFVTSGTKTVRLFFVTIFILPGT